MKKNSIVILLFTTLTSWSQDAKTLLREVNRKFNLVNDYQANVDMKFYIPSIKMNNLSGKVFFKRPNKFKIRAKGIFFLPKQNPVQNISAMLLDTNNYNTLLSGYEMIDGKKCAVVNLIPNVSNNELILGKFWIDIANPLVLKSQITTKNNGTIETLSFYKSQEKYALPDKVIIQLEMPKVKVPKMMSADLKKKSDKTKSDPNAKEKGSIELYFKDYQLNKKFGDEVFEEAKNK